MKRAWLLGSVFFILAGILMLTPQLTGFATYEPATGQMCTVKSDCAKGLACCPVQNSLEGICFEEKQCSSVYYFTSSERQTLALNERKKETATSSSVGDAAGLVLVVVGLALAYVYVATPKKHQSYN